MNAPDPLFEAALRSLDDSQLEAVRHDLLRTGDERYERVVEHLLVRGITVIERVARELCEVRGATARQLAAAVTDSSVRLQLRLTREERLASIQTLAAQIATECVAALRDPAEGPPRLASRPPELRTLDSAISDALRRGLIDRNGGPDS